VDGERVCGVGGARPPTVGGRSGEVFPAGGLGGHQEGRKEGWMGSGPANIDDNLHAEKDDDDNDDVAFYSVSIISVSKLLDC